MGLGDGKNKPSTWVLPYISTGDDIVIHVYAVTDVCICIFCVMRLPPTHCIIACK